MNYYKLIILALIFPITSSGTEFAGLTEIDPPPRIVLERDEDGTMRPVAGSPGPEALFEEVASGSPRRILIGLRTPFAADEVNLHGPDGPDLYHYHAQQARQRFLDEFDQHQPPERRDFPIEEGTEIPFLSLFPSEQSLEFILNHADVVAINTESGGPPLLNESVPFVGADVAHGQGHTGQWRTVGIIDTGVDRNHPMFSGKVVSEACYSSSAYSSIGSICRAGSYGSVGTGTGGHCIVEKPPCTVDPVACVSEAHCQSGHGSHVAGIASGGSVFPGGGLPSIEGVAHGANVIAVMPLSFVESPTICSPMSSPASFFLNLR